MDTGTDINTFLLSWLYCVERMAAKWHKIGGRETHNIGRLFKAYPAGKLGMFHMRPSKESIEIIGQNGVPYSVYYYIKRPIS